MMDIGEREGNEASQTGDAVHLAARAFHREAKGDLRIAIGVMREGLSSYPQADLKRAEQHFRRYAEDPRNAQAEVIYCEEKISIKLDPSEADPTQTQIHIRGTLDQVRRDASGESVWDIKTGRAVYGKQMTAQHAAQLAAYQVGASQLIGRPIQRCGIIRTEDYVTNGPVFWEAPWNYRDALRMLDGVKHVVALLRSGKVWAAPGGQCRFCPQQSIANCVPLLSTLQR